MVTATQGTDNWQTSFNSALLAGTTVAAITTGTIIAIDTFDGYLGIGVGIAFGYATLIGSRLLEGRVSYLNAESVKHGELAGLLTCMGFELFGPRNHTALVTTSALVATAAAGHLAKRC